MDLLAAINIWDMFRDLPKFLGNLNETYHAWVYLILFVIIFCETGLVVAPVLPGDSLLFVSGFFASQLVAGGGEHVLRLEWLLPILCAAPILGDSTNYWIGRFVGPKIFHKEKVRFLNRRHLDKAHEFYQRHGGKAVAVGRFLPIIRTFVPFVAGIGRMSYGRFLAFSVIGTLAWINLCVFAGYYFGGVAFVQKHFETVIIAIVVISLIPAAVAFIRAHLDGRKEAKSKNSATESTENTECRR
jgi:membrane-associated protein